MCGQDSPFSTNLGSTPNTLRMLSAVRTSEGEPAAKMRPSFRIRIWSANLAAIERTTIIGLIVVNSKQEIRNRPIVEILRIYYQRP